MAQPQSVFRRNRLLAALPPEALTALMPKLSNVNLTLGQPLYDVDTEIDRAYFPKSGMISLVANLDDGLQSEVGVIGQEGMLGVSLFSGADRPYVESMVQMAGTALSMGAADFRYETETNPPFRKLLLRYNESLHAQVMQTAACNGHHQLEQRLSRWLLMARDRADSDELALTQEFIAMMLSVRRSGIAVTLGILQRAGLIQHSNGRITIVDRSGLEEASCGCYSVVKRRFDLLMDHPR